MRTSRRKLRNAFGLRFITQQAKIPFLSGFKRGVRQCFLPYFRICLAQNMVVLFRWRPLGTFLQDLSLAWKLANFLPSKD